MPKSAYIEHGFAPHSTALMYSRFRITRSFIFEIRAAFCTLVPRWYGVGSNLPV